MKMKMKKIGATILAIMLISFGVFGLCLFCGADFNTALLCVKVAWFALIFVALVALIVLFVGLLLQYVFED